MDLWCLVVPLGGGPIDLGFGNIGGWGGPRPDQGLPGGQGGRPSQPIYHPGHPDHGLPPYPDNTLPSIPDRIDNALPEGEEIPNNELPIPEPPADYADDVVVAIKQPGEEWVIKAYEQDTRPDQGLPPTPAPKARK